MARTSKLNDTMDHTLKRSIHILVIASNKFAVKIPNSVNGIELKIDISPKNLLELTVSAVAHYDILITNFPPTEDGYFESREMVSILARTYKNLHILIISAASSNIDLAKVHNQVDGIFDNPYQERTFNDCYRIIGAECSPDILNHGVVVLKKYKKNRYPFTPKTRSVYDAINNICYSISLRMKDG